MGHLDIAEVAIVGLPDARTGERACAGIVAAADGGPDVADLREFLEARGMARFKAPEQVALPKNSYGKVVKRALRDRLTPHPR